ncbi:hypothetical protein K438DRAFT_1984407 [Mycena galopus ATCC 62051]|nr:hypothetical protein K438DRAFT_1984407 [Mycena galopus ATCC 62051]
MSPSEPLPPPAPQLPPGDELDPPPRILNQGIRKEGDPGDRSTVVSLFRTYDDDEEFGPEGGDDGLLISAGELPEVHTRPEGFWSLRAWRRYFRPLTRKVYYRSLFHLYVVNFPFALAAFLFAVVFTVETTLLVALPLGALLCFFNLFGVRTFSRGEVLLSLTQHRIRLDPYSPACVRSTRPASPFPETSFYKNTYAMFTDPTSYQALFYFLVIKPSITLLLSLGLLVVGIPAIVLANVAVEGLYLAVR